MKASAWGGALVAVAVFSGWSYLEEKPKHDFERAALQVGAQLPGARLITASKVVDISSPITWFWPAAEVITYGMPDPLLHYRFFIMGMSYERPNDASTYLIDADCKEHSGIWYDLDEPESALPARNTWGDPVVAPNGQTYRRMKAQIELPGNWLHDFCETDWTIERQAVAKRMGLDAEAPLLPR